MSVSYASVLQFFWLCTLAGIAFTIGAMTIRGVIGILAGALAYLFGIRSQEELDGLRDHLQHIREGGVPVTVPDDEEVAALRQALQHYVNSVPISDPHTAVAHRILTRMGRDA